MREESIENDEIGSEETEQKESKVWSSSFETVWKKWTGRKQSKRYLTSIFEFEFEFGRMKHAYV